MEPQTRFDLTQALVDWRRDLSQQPGMGREEVRELEAHLNDSVARLQSAGLSDKEAFHVAAGRLGSTDQIAREFAEAHPSRVWTERVFWMVAGVVGLTLSNIVIATVQNALFSRGPIWLFVVGSGLIWAAIGAVLLGLSSRGVSGAIAKRFGRMLSMKGAAVVLLVCAGVDFLGAIYRVRGHQLFLENAYEKLGVQMTYNAWMASAPGLTMMAVLLSVMSILARRMNRTKWAQ